MSNTLTVDNLSSLWIRLVSQKQYNAALLTGYLGYVISLETKDDELKVRAASWIEGAMQGIRESLGLEVSHDVSSSPSCSFCGRGEPEVQLAAGAKAFICNSCVGTVSAVFAGKKGDLRRE